jgi:adenylate cyclase
MSVGVYTMFGFWRGSGGEQRPAVSAEFEHALTREVLRTELVRVRALVATTLLLTAIVGTGYFLAPDAVNAVWRGGLKPSSLYATLVPFILFELWVHAAIRRQLKLHRDVPVVRRYLGALIETSMPTIALALHIQNMGSVQALGFVAPLAYFIFIILSTLRLDFWLSTFTGFVAAVELFGMAIFYHPAGNTDPEPEIWYHAVRSLIILVCGVLAGAVGVRLRRQFEASIQAATARDRIINLFGQHVSPQVVERLLVEGANTAGDIHKIAVMFIDFRGFTAGARSRSPQEVVDRLDGAFAVLVEIIDRHDGIVNKFLGDGFMALFRAPHDSPEAASHAVAAAREMLVAMNRVNQASTWPLRIGIGVNFGEVVVGNIGSPRRKEYTVIGDTVNFAARLEQLNKEFNSQLLVSASVRDALGGEVNDAVSLGEVPVRGYDRPMTVWQLG